MAPKRSLESSINLNVGGVYYSLRQKDIQRFPDSFFAHLLKDEWNADKSAVVRLDRDGEAFRHIQHYIYTSKLEPCSDSQFILPSDLLAVLREADFYNLPDLVGLCKSDLRNLIPYWCCNDVQSADLVTTYACVAEGDSPIVDPMLQAMCPLRRASIATAQLPSFEHDCYNLKSIADQTSNCVLYASSLSTDALCGKPAEPRQASVHFSKLAFLPRPTSTCVIRTLRVCI